jgi:hypothetical protein
MQRLEPSVGELGRLLVALDERALDFLLHDAVRVLRGAKG